MSQSKPGQRWISESEPELGLGTLLSHGFGRAEIHFPATGEIREYATASAPLRRIRFQVGEILQGPEGLEYRVTKVTETEGLLTYICGDQEIPEAELYDRMSFSSPKERILSGRTDDYRTFALRTEGLRHKARIAGSPARGLTGGRIDLIPHQIAIASTVTSRPRARVLLADEVGLGKTIEACLILQRLHLTHRADRILIVLPEPLVHQWFVELLRRFNLLFSIFDEERCQAIESGEGAPNPFLDEQRVICSIGWLTDNPRRVEQAHAAKWDLLIVDEAHHLEWQPEQPSPAYQAVEALASNTENLLLLTATPQQLGPEGHFARLRLLDPHRYHDLKAFREESRDYEQLATLIDSVLEGSPLRQEDIANYAERCDSITPLLESYHRNPGKGATDLAHTLLDHFGTSRSLFRNTRKNLSGFPNRLPQLHPLKIGSESHSSDKLDWLADLLSKFSTEKFLLICKTRDLVDEIAEEIQDRIAIDIARFHEELSLLQRDRNAAFFAQESGARLLICSEIGSEGRNFQFAHHLILYDLPENPELLEQRIGRLDRIGQSKDIQIHVPYRVESAEEVLALWYQEGLKAFEKSLQGAHEIARCCHQELQGALAKPNKATLQKLLKKSRALVNEIALRLERGHDRLVELNSARPGESAKLIESIREWDEQTRLEDFFLRLLDFFQLQIEDLDHRSYLITGNEQLTHKLPAIPDQGIALTFDRSTALKREDFHFASIDHPMLQGGLDTLLSGEMGNCAFAVWETPGEKNIFVEAYYVIECLAPPALHVDRFLAPIPIRLVLDYQGKNHTQNETLARAEFLGGNIHKLLANETLKQKILPKIFRQLDSMASKLAVQLAERSSKFASRELDQEIERSRALSINHPDISLAEIESLETRREAILEHISKARPRLDCMRLIFKRPTTAKR